MCRFGHGEVLQKKISFSQKMSKAGENYEEEIEEVDSEKEKSGVYEIEKSLWRIGNIPENSDEISLLKMFENLGVSVQTEECDVRSIKYYAGKEGKKVEAEIIITDQLGQKLLEYNGKQIENGLCLEIMQMKSCGFGAKCFIQNCPLYHPESVLVRQFPMKSKIDERVEKKDLSKENERQNVEFVNSWWALKNLPEKMNNPSILRYISNLGIFEDSNTKKHCNIYSSKKYDTTEGKKMEAVVKVPLRCGLKLQKCNGIEIENSNLEVVQIKECKFGANCYNIDKGCPLVHEKTIGKINSGKLSRQTSELRSVQSKCWFQKACPFKDNCKFSHDFDGGGHDSSQHISDLGSASASSKNFVNRTTSGI